MCRCIDWHLRERCSGLADAAADAVLLMQLPTAGWLDSCVTSCPH